MTTPSEIPPQQPVIPLTPDVRAAYQNLYDKYEAAIENTTDPTLLAELNSSQADVDDVLSKDDMYRLHANAALFQELLDQINCTNAGLKTLQAEIAATASRIKAIGDILSAINQVVTLIPG